MINPSDVTSVTEISAEQFELLVKETLQSSGKGLSSFKTRHREKLQGVDGTYEIDVTARFRAMGADFIVLIECKHHRSAIKRSDVQVLHDRLQSTGAQKAMIFSTAGFQKGALDYAMTHNIALVRIAEGRTSYETRSLSLTREPPPWKNISPYVAWRIKSTEGSGIQVTLLSRDYPEYLDEFLEE
jgi:restriction system protein